MQNIKPTQTFYITVYNLTRFQSAHESFRTMKNIQNRFSNLATGLNYLGSSKNHECLDSSSWECDFMGLAVVLDIRIYNCSTGDPNVQQSVRNPEWQGYHEPCKNSSAY